LSTFNRKSRMADIFTAENSDTLTAEPSADPLFKNFPALHFVSPFLYLAGLDELHAFRTKMFFLSAVAPHSPAGRISIFIAKEKLCGHAA